MNLYFKMRQLFKVPEGAPAPRYVQIFWRDNPNRAQGTYDPQLDLYELKGIRFTGQWLRNHREELTPK